MSRPLLMDSDGLSPKQESEIPLRGTVGPFVANATTNEKKVRGPRESNPRMRQRGSSGYADRQLGRVCPGIRGPREIDDRGDRLALASLIDDERFRFLLECDVELKLRHDYSRRMR